MLKHYDIVLSSIRSISKTSPGLSNKNYLYAMSAFMYNYSVGIIEKNLQKENELISAFAETLRMRVEIEKDEENITLFLQAASNILSKHYEKHRSDFGWVKKYIGQSTNKDLIDDLSMLLG